MTRRKILSLSTAIVIGASALIAGGTSASAATAEQPGSDRSQSTVSDRLPTPDTYLGQLGSQSTDSDQLPTPDTYLGQLGVDLGPSSVAPTLVSDSPETVDGFDWGSAAIGAAAGAGLAALVAGSLALITVRRRTSPVSASMS